MDGPMNVGSNMDGPMHLDFTTEGVKMVDPKVVTEPWVPFMKRETTSNWILLGILMMMAVIVLVMVITSLFICCHLKRKTNWKRLVLIYQLSK